MRFLFALAFMFLTACGQAPDQDSSFELAVRSTLKASYPLNPVETVTPGVTCQDPDEYRYPEHIPYCERSVSTSTKNKIIKSYDTLFQFTIGSMPRNDFKIDHYIPLCMGGDNSIANLWPQHKSVYQITDALEQKLCLWLERATITQAFAITQMKYAKNHLSEVPAMTKTLDDAYGN